MKLNHKVTKNGQYVSSVEVFYLTSDKKNPKQRVAFVDSKMVSFVYSGTCRCGGKIVEVMKNPVDWRTCEKCGKDHSVHSFPRKLVGWSGYLS